MSSILEIDRVASKVCPVEASDSSLHSFTGKTVQRNYILNDTAALKKKVRHESRKEAFNTGTDAKDGSNVVLLFKTSFFEHVKNHFLQDLIQQNDITQIKNAVGAKVSSEASGDAFVEYSVEVQFKAHNSDYSCKMIVYTTSCKIMFQPLGVEATTKISSSKSISRYFVDTFFLPWCETAYQKKEFDEMALLEAINAEIR